MDEEKQIDIEAIPPGERNGYYSYLVTSTYSRDTLTMTPQELLEIAAWVEEHRAELELQAEANKAAERNE